MHKKRLPEHQSSEQPTKVTQILNWLKDFITTVPLVGSCLALLYLVTGEQVVGFLLAVSSIMYLIVRDGLSAHYDENIWLASSGGGIGGYWGDIRSNGISTTHGSKSTGSIPFMHVVDSQMLAFNQGTTRRGSYAAYMDISHPEIEEFINMRKESGGDINRKNLNLHNGINITNEFLKAVQEDADFRLIDPKTHEAYKDCKC